MSDKKKKYELITFPKGVAVYPALYKPDTRFDELGQYKADFKVPMAEAKPFMEKLQKIIKEHVGKAYPAKKNPFWEYELDKETGEETGFVVFKVRAKNKISKKTGKVWDRKPPLINAKKQDLPDDCNPWGGSVIRVQGEVYLYDQPKKGGRLDIVLVQVIELVTGGSKADASAFDEEEVEVEDIDEEADAEADGQEEAETEEADY